MPVSRAAAGSGLDGGWFCPSLPFSPFYINTRLFVGLGALLVACTTVWWAYWGRARVEPVGGPPMGARWRLLSCPAGTGSCWCAAR
jgi:hypothetical protein